jgi:hypothetical protein
MMQKMRRLIIIENRSYMLIEGRTNMAQLCFSLFERSKLTGPKVVFALFCYIRILILTCQLDGETAPSVKVWIH